MPLGDVQAGEQVLGHGHDAVDLDRGLAPRAALGVLGLDPLADAGKPAAQHLLRDDALFGGQGVEDRIAVLTSGA